MLKVILARLQQKHRTIKYPDAPPPPVPDRFRGRPQIELSKCDKGCQKCMEACPTGALQIDKKTIDLGKCLFCTDCADSCSKDAITY